MVTTYNIGSPSAEIKLTAIMAAHGGVVYDSIGWELHDTDEKKPNHILYKSDDSQAALLVKPGQYRIFIRYAGETLDCGIEELEKNTSTDRVYLLNDDGLFDETKQYSAETDAFLEYERRKEDRKTEVTLGSIDTPLKDPYYKPEGSSSLSAHPLLSQKAQFDGMPPEITPEPTENNEAANKNELTLQNELKNEYAAQATNTTKPSPL